MATKKKGILTTSPEWVRHLRPIMKRWFWKGERNAESVHIKAETGSKFIHSVEELLLEVESWDTQADEKRLHVAIPIMLKGNVVQPTIGMSIVLDKVLGKGYSPNKAIEQQSGTIYFYTR